MPLAETFQEVVDALPSDWTDLELDLRVEVDRYIDAATLLVTCNAQPYSMPDWNFRLLRAPTFGHAPGASPTRSARPPRRRPCTARSSCSTTPGSPASCCCARCARGASRRSR